MTPGPLPADKRLLAKRTVRKIAKKVRSSRKPQSARSCIEEVWHILENPNSDDVSKMCSRQLLLLRVQLKDKVRGYFNGECSFEDLVQHTGLTREAVMATLGKHNAFHRDTDDRVNDDKLGQGVPSVEITDDGRKECNATFVVPKLDISDVRKDAPSSDDDDTS
ncbi:hypothetical protein NECAME_05435 [Necator americanus]|uniref:Uncharacterized protein n=1 Tax=Necator americanus TaxID=51031 RepID=W2SJ14_NECAM|nr:hypothetical protein NECAME_05435 [Necator americanus]ETN68846.1 hypothetical protein NECAME_05435 [Necator americanus]